MTNTVHSLHRAGGRQICVSVSGTQEQDTNDLGNYDPRFELQRRRFSLRGELLHVFISYRYAQVAAQLKT
jgi:hypothetical protein